MTTTEPGWVPQSCTLPPAEQPLRLAEFDDLFAAGLRTVDATSPTQARLRLTGPAGLATTVRDLAARESGCCSFFRFTVAVEPADDGETVILDVEVPQQHTAVLAALVQRATTVGKAAAADTRRAAT